MCYIQPNLIFLNKVLKEFILLEDVTFSFKNPCVLDLKMGTRCFGDGSTQAKYERKKKRALESTSATLGVRLCGMMVKYFSFLLPLLLLYIKN